MDIQQLKYNYELLKTKKILDKEFHMVSKEIEGIQNNCKHIPVILGHNGTDSCIGIIDERCLICGIQNPNKVKSYPYLIDATFYKKEKYGHGKIIESRENRLHDLQELWLNYMQELPDDKTEDKILKLIKSIKKDEK